jgi:ABC-type multidrug transport system fused ATPase/permease subunit
MEGITYRYRNAADDVLADITFAARPGRVTAVVGEIGAGKSTAMMLLARLIDPTEGRVLVGGRDARDWNPVELRRAIGYVPQEAQLLSGSVLENVRFGRNWIDPGDIDAAIDIARLRGDLAVWPDGLETRVGSRGLRISGGQQQRVALARALAGRPSLLLLDDCTASLDAETEQAVWNALLAAMPGCTTILVTHRPAALRRCDQIVVLDRGRIRELGTFDDLDRDETHFHRLFLRWSMCEDVPT